MLRLENDEDGDCREADRQHEDLEHRLRSEVRGRRAELVREDLEEDDEEERPAGYALEDAVEDAGRGGRQRDAVDDHAGGDAGRRRDREAEARAQDGERRVVVADEVERERERDDALVEGERREDLDDLRGVRLQADGEALEDGVDGEGEEEDDGAGG